jgi:lysophospholipase L1-like esterase
MKRRTIWRKMGEKVFLMVGIPFIFMAILEAIIRLSGIETDVIKSKNIQIAMPVWVANDVTFLPAEWIYKRVSNNDLDADSLEWLQYFEEAQYVHYKMKPNLSAYITNTVNRIELEKGIKIFVKSNSEGFRTEEIPIQKGKNVYRIVLLGDSSTFGWGVNQDERFSKLLEDKLNSVQDSKHYEIINLGIPGYATEHGIAVFDRYALRYSPDMIILSFGPNDGKLISKDAKEALKSRHWIRDLKEFLRNFATYRLFRKVLLSFYNPFDTLVQAQKNSPKEPFATIPEYQKNLEYIIDKGRERGIESVFLALCCPKNYREGMSAVAERKKVPLINGMEILSNRIKDVKEEKLYPDLARYYKNLYGEESLKNRPLWYVTNDTCHPNAVGHGILADVLYEQIFVNKIQP